MPMIAPKDRPDVLLRLKSAACADPGGFPAVNKQFPHGKAGTSIRAAKHKEETLSQPSWAEKRMGRKSNTSYWFEAIGIIVGGYSLFSLVNSAFEFGLSDLFARLTSIYRAIFHPLIGVFSPPLDWVAARFGLALPENWRDIAIFYLTISGAVIRVHARPEERLPVFVRMIVAISLGLVWFIPLLLFPIGLIASKNPFSLLKQTLLHYRDVITQIVYAIGALILFLALNAIGA